MCLKKSWGSGPGKFLLVAMLAATLVGTPGCVLIDWIGLGSTDGDETESPSPGEGEGVDAGVDWTLTQCLALSAKNDGAELPQVCVALLRERDGGTEGEGEGEGVAEGEGEGEGATPAECLPGESRGVTWVCQAEGRSPCILLPAGENNGVCQVICYQMIDGMPSFGPVSTSDILAEPEFCAPQDPT